LEAKELMAMYPQWSKERSGSGRDKITREGIRNFLF
jgi:hypothetical protein